MTFEVFTRKNLRGSPHPTVTVKARGGLSLNRGAFEALGEPSFVQLMLDRDNKLLGIKPAREDDGDAYAVNQKSLSINAAAFIRYAGVAPDDGTARRWSASLDGDVLCWNIGEPGTKVTSNRAKASA